MTLKNKEKNDFNTIQCQLQTNYGRPKAPAELWDDVKQEIIKKNKDTHHPKNNKSTSLNDKRYVIYSEKTDIYFTRREALTMAYFLEDKTIKEAAQLQHISPRTVEAYLSNMKRKLNCRNKKALINQIKNSDFYKKFAAGHIL